MARNTRNDAANAKGAGRQVRPRRRWQWLAAWLGLVVSSVILVTAGWLLLNGSDLAELALPVAIAAVNLAIVLPVVRAGRPGV